MEIIVDVRKLYGNTAKLEKLEGYVSDVVSKADQANIVVLTGPAPIWLYLAIAHALHGRAKKLIYRSPVTGDVLIFDHDPY